MGENARFRVSVTPGLFCCVTAALILMTCIFCGSGTTSRLTREHVLPRWALDEFGLRNEHVQPTHFGTDRQILSARLHTYSQLVAGRVCEDCNSGWMSRLENANKNLITELGHGRKDMLDLDDAAAIGLARWAFKTALALHAASNYRKIIPDEHYRHLTLDPSTLPSGVRVVGKNWPVPCGFSWVQSPSWWVHQPARELADSEFEKLESDGYKICICLSQLLLLVAFNPLRNTRDLLWKYVHVPLYPRSGPVAWLEHKPDLPKDDSMKAVIFFHGSYGLVPE